jgi:hypothetical protein
MLENAQKIASQKLNANTSQMLFAKASTEHEVETISLEGGSLAALEGEFHHHILQYSKSA